ncbi:MAG TPA: phosphate/sulfate permease, partial [Gammaproteobacteria bacterium]|nr:phosphate/sulfate permease [Gammaproteobacteria bacterium]
MHLFRQDALTRYALILAGVFGAYSLGANNIANVMGPFVGVVQFNSVDFYGLFSLNPLQQLFLLGGVAISIGVFTYSRRVMFTVGRDLYNLSPVAGWVVIMAHSIVLFLFASKGLSAWLNGVGLPQMPLVPVSSSQAVIGAVLGIGLIRGRHGIRWGVLGEIGLGWLLTP